MNIDKDLVARAFAKAGEEPITDTEWGDAESSRVRIVKEFYLATVLEALSSYNWTSQKKRARLSAMDNYEYEEVLNPKKEDINKYYEYIEDPYHPGVYYYHKTETFESGKTYYIRYEVNLTGLNFMYPLPADCAKVISINDTEPYVVEGGFLFCNVENAIILYVRNYFTGKYVYQQVAQSVAADVYKYYYKDENDDYIKETTFDTSKTYYVIVEEDYNFYGKPDFSKDPELSAYIECKLAAGIALKLTGGTDKYQMLYNEARLIADGAMKRSAEQAQNRTKGNKWWTDELGLTSGGEIHAYN